jgi:hypothetical protein
MYCIGTLQTDKKVVFSTALPDVGKGTALFESIQVLRSCFSDLSSFKMKMSVENVWNGYLYVKTQS